MKPDRKTRFGIVIVLALSLSGLTAGQDSPAAYPHDALFASGPVRVFEGHLVQCPPCRNYLDTYKETVELGKSLCNDPEGPVPENVPEELVQAILSARRQSD